MMFSKPYLRSRFCRRFTDFLNKLLPFECATNHEQQILEIDRFGQVIIGAGLDGLDRVLDRPERRNQITGISGSCGPDLLKQLDPGHTRAS